MLLTNLHNKTFTLSIIFILFSNLIFGQSDNEIEKLLIDVCRVSDSKDIIRDKSAMQISDYQDKSLNILTDFFIDDSKTEVYSKCLKRKLNRGEVAIILCDRIEIMPYFQLIKMQNTGLSFCKDNPNFVEPYLDIIKKQSTKAFQEKYVKWLHSEERMNTKIYDL